MQWLPLHDNLTSQDFHFHFPIFPRIALQMGGVYKPAACLCSTFSLFSYCFWFWSAGFPKVKRKKQSCNNGRREDRNGFAAFWRRLWTNTHKRKRQSVYVQNGSATRRSATMCLASLQSIHSHWQSWSGPSSSHSLQSAGRTSIQMLSDERWKEHLSFVLHATFHWRLERGPLQHKQIVLRRSYLWENMIQASVIVLSNGQASLVKRGCVHIIFTLAAALGNRQLWLVGRMLPLQIKHLCIIWPWSSKRWKAWNASVL